MTADPLPQGWSAALGPHAPPEARHPLDAHAWRIEAGDAALLFDAGAGLGPAPKAADALFLTHGHGDHALGAARLRLPTFSGPLTAEWLAAGDADRISLPKAIAAGVYPPGTRLAPLPRDHRHGRRRDPAVSAPSPSPPSPRPVTAPITPPGWSKRPPPAYSSAATRSLPGEP